MFPTLVTFELPLLGPVVIQTYGVAAATAFVVGLAVAQRRLGRIGIDPFHTYWAAVFLVPAIAVGGKLLPLTQNPFYRQQLLQLADGPLGWPGLALVLAMPGGSLLSSAVAGLGAALLYARYYRLPTLPCLDAVSPGVALAIPIMRVGCLGAGCCFGTPTTLAWGIVYETSVTASATGVPLGVPLHPSQLYEALAVLVLGAVLMRRDFADASPGTTTAWFVGGYAAVRFLTEFVRGDSQAGPHLGAFTLTQVAAGLLLLACVLFLRRARSNR